MKLFEKLPVILDGAFGTEMQKRGFVIGSCAEQWVLENPEQVREVQRGYMDAGSDILYAPTFGANRILLSKYGRADSVREYNLKLAELTLELAQGRALVGGDMAPTGAAPEPFGDLSIDELTEVFSDQAKYLEEAGIDLFAIETQLSGIEAKAAVTAVRLHSKKPIFVSLTCTENGKTFYGESFPELLSSMQELDIQAFGINCCGDFELLKRLITEMKPVAKIPLIVKPNAGKPEVIDGIPSYCLTPETFSAHMTEIYKLGASLLGGCCGTHKGHIAALSDSICCKK